MGIKCLNLSSFWTISTIKDEKSAAKFHYIKTVSSKVVAQSIAFRVVSIYWQGVVHSLDIWTQRDRPALEAPALHTLRLIARQSWRHCVTSLRSAHWLASSLKLARCPVSGCWPSCSKMIYLNFCALTAVQKVYLVNRPEVKSALIMPACSTNAMSQTFAPFIDSFINGSLLQQNWQFYWK